MRVCRLTGYLALLAIVYGCGGQSVEVTPVSKVSPVTNRARRTGIEASYLAFDSMRGVVYSTDLKRNLISIVDPKTGKAVGAIPMVAMVGELAITDDCQFLYTRSGGQIFKVDLATKSTKLSYFIDPALEHDASAPIDALSIRTQPGHPNTLAVAVMNSLGAMHPSYGIRVFTEGVTGFGGVYIGSGIPSYGDACFSSDGKSLYTLVRPTLVYCSTAVTGIPPTTTQILPNSTSGDWSYVVTSRGKCFIGTSVFSESDQSSVGRFTVPGFTFALKPFPDADRGIALSNVPNVAGSQLSILDTNSLSTLKTFALSSFEGFPTGDVSSPCITGSNQIAVLVRQGTPAVSEIVFIDYVAS